MIRHRFTIPVSADAALAAHRDGLPYFARDLPGLSSVTLESHARQGATEVLHHHWQGDIHLLPAAIRRLVSPEQVSWKDHGRWNADAGVGTWEIHIPVLGEGPHVRGKHTFQDVDGHAEVAVEAELCFVAEADTTLLGMRVGRWLAPVLSAAVRGIFERILLHSGEVVTAWVREQESVERRAA